MAKTWSSKEEAYLYESYNNMTNTQLGEMFGVTPKAISHKMRRLRDRAIREAEKRECKQREIKQQKKAEEVLEQEYYEQESYEPLNLPHVRLYEKMINVNGRAINLISTGFFVKTEVGWSQIMMRKRKLLQLT